MIVIARLDRDRPYRAAAHPGRADIVGAETVVGDAQQIPLDLRSHDARIAALGETAQRFAQKLTRREMKRRAVVEIFVAQDPADAGRPRQYAECRRIGDDGQIGRTRHLVEAHPAAARERGENARAGRIERRGGDTDIVAVAQCRQECGYRQCLGARIAVRVAPCQPDEVQLFGFDAARDLGGKPPLFVAPQAMLFDEIRSLGFCHHARKTSGGVKAQAASTPRRAVPRNAFAPRFTRGSVLSA